MWPKAIGKGTAVRGADGLLRVSRADRGTEFILDSLAEVVWDLCDGSRTVETLAEQARQTLHRAVSMEDVFSALDFLADAGLLEHRIAPPAAEVYLSRRALLARIRPAISTAASLAIIGPSAKADEYSTKESNSKESSSKESSSKANSRESSSKESNSKANSQEDNRKEDNAKHNRQEDNRKEDKTKYNKQEDNNNEDKAKYRRQEDNSKEDDRKEDNSKENIRRRGEENQKESNRKSLYRDLATQRRNAAAEASIRARWPQIYTVVGHKLSEFPSLASGWRTARAAVLSTNTPTGDAWNNWSLFFQTCDKFEAWMRANAPRLALLFVHADFVVNGWPGPKPVRLSGYVAGIEWAKTALQLEHVGPADTYIRALDPDNLRWSFTDPEAALQFLSLRDRKK
jgi:hypothetical protein